MKRIVITGGPGAGKSVITAEIIRRFPQRFAVVPEAATQVYNSLQTRWDRLDVDGRREVQRKIYHFQLAQEDRISRDNPGKTILLDRGTIDGATYWPEGPDAYWADLGTNLAIELKRYDKVILLETAATLGIYDGEHSNNVRFEPPKAAIEAGEKLLKLWRLHPDFHRVPAFENLDDKIAATIALL